MSLALSDLGLFLALVAVIGSIGAGLGIFFVAPRLTRLTDRSDEEPGGGDD
ncbi:MAG: hypothetical protein ABI555_09750 [Chloroflexota bacterium]